MQGRHIQTLHKGTLPKSLKDGGCGLCHNSCQSACKSSLTVGNQSCENARRR